MMAAYESIADSGAREEMPTGSVRDTRDGKGRYDLVSPLALARLAKHHELGAKKYRSNNGRNWELGQPLSRFFDSAVRHMYRYLEGHRDEDHLAAAMWNIQGIIHTEEMIERGLLPRELHDLPNYLEPRTASEQATQET